MTSRSRVLVATVSLSFALLWLVLANGTNAAGPWPQQESLNSHAPFVTSRTIQDQWIGLHKNGMENGRAGFHLVVPSKICGSVGGGEFPRIDDFVFSDKWAFWDAQGTFGERYFLGNDSRNYPNGGYPPDAPVSFRRVFGNGLFTYEVVATSNDHGIEATLDQVGLLSLQNRLSIRRNDDGFQYFDWFGIPTPSTDPPGTEMIVALVADDVAYQSVDISAIVTQGVAPRTFLVVDGVSLEHAQNLLGRLH